MGTEIVSDKYIRTAPQSAEEKHGFMIVSEHARTTQLQTAAGTCRWQWFISVSSGQGAGFGVRVTLRPTLPLNGRIKFVD